MSGRDARTQPMRRPPQAILLSDPTVMTRSPGIEGRDRRRRADPERRVRRQVLDDLEADSRGEPDELAAARLGHVTPVGLWKVGMT